jgi:thioesterase domain-containing protein
LVAYEIASQLIQQGEEVEFVGLIDTSLPGLAAASAFAMHADPVELGTAHASLAASEGGREVLRRWIDNSEACRGAYLRYRPQALATAVHLFVADHSIRGDYPKAWVELLGDAARLHPLPGTHGSILREPHVAGLAAALSAALQPVHTSRATRGTGES